MIEVVRVQSVSRPGKNKHLRLLEGSGRLRRDGAGTRNASSIGSAAIVALREVLDSLNRDTLACYVLVVKRDAEVTELTP